jgi:RNase adaptor protein for sRNA GlmZ degradation
LLASLRAGIWARGRLDGSAITFGCHGWRHRSFAMAGRFKLPLEAYGHDVSVKHLGLRLT